MRNMQSMKKSNLSSSLLLYAVTDSHCLVSGSSLASLVDAVQKAIAGGITFLQLREKEIRETEFLARAIALKKICSREGIPFVINDSVPIAEASGADGVHLGQSDMNAKDARRILGPNKIIGVSCRTVEQAKKAENEGADYIGCGAVFKTTTKEDASSLSLETLKKICSAITIPTVAIGGITKENIHFLSDSGISGIAVVSAIFSKNDIEKETANLKTIAKQILFKEKI